uniref:Uncharacterized protein n=1 Tax=Helianthus annuus TaxID=4232 RepID=A0A251TGN5_HELAN
MDLSRSILYIFRSCINKLHVALLTNFSWILVSKVGFTYTLLLQDYKFMLQNSFFNLTMDLSRSMLKLVSYKLLTSLTY